MLTPLDEVIITLIVPTRNTRTKMFLMIRSTLEMEIALNRVNGPRQRTDLGREKGQKIVQKTAQKLRNPPSREARTGQNLEVKTAQGTDPARDTRTTRTDLTLVFIPTTCTTVDAVSAYSWEAVVLTPGPV